MPRPVTLSDIATHRLDLLISKDLLGEEPPSVTLYDLSNEGELLNSAVFMAAYLTEQLKARGSDLEVKEVERYYFDFSPYGPVLGPICYLGLYDSSGARRLFTLGTYKPGVTWMPEQNKGPQFEKDRRFLVGGQRQRDFRNQVDGAALGVTAPMAAKVRAFVESRELTEDQQYDLAEVLKYTSWEKMKLEELVYVALVVGATLEEILQESAG
jgi:predicted dehydrogenase